jgi:hypothetical protein
MDPNILNIFTFRRDSPDGRWLDSGISVDYFRLLFAYTDTHVSRTRKL